MLNRIGNLLFQPKLVFTVFILLFGVDNILLYVYGGGYYERSPLLYSTLIITAIYVILGLSIFFKRITQLFNIHRIIPALIAFLAFHYLFNVIHVQITSPITPLINLLTVIALGLFFSSMVAFIEILVMPKSRSRKKHLLYFGLAIILMTIDTLM